MFILGLAIGAVAGGVFSFLFFRKNQAKAAKVNEVLDKKFKN